MAPSYTCKHETPSCQQFRSASLNEALDHLSKHDSHKFLNFSKFLPVPDSRGNIWYCYACERKSGRKHRSFRSDQAVWDHLVACNGDSILKDIEKSG